jgi:hypothetical protein
MNAEDSVGQSLVQYGLVVGASLFWEELVWNGLVLIDDIGGLPYLIVHRCIFSFFPSYKQCNNVHVREHNTKYLG